MSEYTEKQKACAEEITLCAEWIEDDARDQLGSLIEQIIQKHFPKTEREKEIMGIEIRNKFGGVVTTLPVNDIQIEEYKKEGCEAVPIYGVVTVEPVAWLMSDKIDPQSQWVTLDEAYMNEKKRGVYRNSSP